MADHQFDPDSLQDDNTAAEAVHTGALSEGGNVQPHSWYSGYEWGHTPFEGLDGSQAKALQSAFHKSVSGAADTPTDTFEPEFGHAAIDYAHLPGPPGATDTPTDTFEPEFGHAAIDYAHLPGPPGATDTPTDHQADENQVIPLATADDATEFMLTSANLQRGNAAAKPEIEVEVGPAVVEPHIEVEVGPAVMEPQIRVDIGPAERGPGQWQRDFGDGENMTDAQARYQAQVTGSPVTQTYYVGGRSFDGFEQGENGNPDTLIEAKYLNDNGRFAKAYDNFANGILDKNGNSKDFWYLIDQASKLMGQAEAQIRAAEGTGARIEWRVSGEHAAQVLRLIFDLNETTRGRISVQHVAEKGIRVADDVLDGGAKSSVPGGVGDEAVTGSGMTDAVAPAVGVVAAGIAAVLAARVGGVVIGTLLEAGEIEETVYASRAEAEAAAEASPSVRFRIGESQPRIRVDIGTAEPDTLEIGPQPVSPRFKMKQ